jgi:hypothetical protein
MGDMSGKPVEIIPGTPKDVAGLRKTLIDQLSKGAKSGATRYGGQLSAGVNPMQTAGADMISKLMGYGGYKNKPMNLGGSNQWGGGIGLNPGMAGGGGDIPRPISVPGQPPVVPPVVPSPGGPGIPPITNPDPGILDPTNPDWKEGRRRRTPAR